MAYCGHLSITKNINSWNFKSLIKAECEICDGFLLYKKNNGKEYYIYCINSFI